MNEIVDYFERHWIGCSVILVLIIATIAFIWVMLDKSQIVHNIVINIFKK